ncbi:conserved hypothetical protein [Leishmania infantum JPCM5]|uniref:Uncharacterized protein n=2 Tax=Leishmania infantum TaxID=5671 RepID=A4I1B1_LEIIN|nr:conserved hypothetical protein [Leishmania infantum JPCM5]CAC9493747.1 hypothetical_protein_-_conserved [Leishmania infantum]CAM68539.1 conserved hypothetical protein [Leishmania infantum JPCM5]SUZ42394.1 hypothetical_protein_-_conserved [Leishmania infantum]|eukprot:XP_001466102.1 conserved hypothetical protein [Leishmania infantum JPCM5]
MSHRGVPFKARAGKAATAAADEPGNSVPLTSPSDALNGRKGADLATGKGTTSGEEFVCVRAIAQAGSSSSAQLTVVHRLLKSVLAAAGNVVRGTDSQRKFTSLYTEFCISAVRSLADVEDAVYELTNPGCRAADAADCEIEGIDDAEFLKQVAAYVATHTSALGVAYLEHVGRSALEKLQKQQRKRERSTTTGSGSAATSGHRPAKVSRTLIARGAGAQAAHGGAAVDMHDSSHFDSLGLVDAQETMRCALQAIESEKQTAVSAPTDAAAASRRGLQAFAATQLGLGYSDARPSGVFLSRAPGGLSAAATTSGGTPLGNGTVAYELRDPHLKLSSIPELSARMQPWTIPLPSSGVYLDRVTMERDRRGGNASGNETSTATAAVEPTKAALEVCLAPTPMEFLRQWESREAALAAEQQQQPSSAPAFVGGPYSVVPYAGSGSRAGGPSTGGSPRSTAPLSTPPLCLSPNSSPLGHHPPFLPESEARTSGADVDPISAFSSAFFPAVRDKRTTTSLPTYVMANLSHYGVSKMEYVYTMGPTSK